MKKLFSVVLIGACAILSAKAQVEFSYEAGADLVSSYLWRGQYLGGLSIQPSLSVGFEGEHTSLSVGAWGSFGATDWGFRKGLAENENGDPNTYFAPEIDLTASFSFFGATIGITHYYYFGGSPFFCWNKLANFDVENQTSTTELMIGYNFNEILKEQHNLYVNWYTNIAGNDFIYDDSDNATGRAFSSYLELGYDYTFEDAGLTLGAQLGFVPWGTDFYSNEKFALKCLSLRLDKEWEFNHCSLDLFAQGMLDCDGLDKSNTFIKASGDDKIETQKLNGCIGLGIWF